MNFQIPHLRETQGSAQLVVHDEPFLMLPAELHNSSLSSPTYMESIWPMLQAWSINTVLGAVTWEMIEPKEDVFEFGELDRCILGARKHNLHLVLLWFGSYKNAMSTYVPTWVKRNVKRFPRVHVASGHGGVKTLELLSPFNRQAWEADAKAFARLMKHLKEFDEGYSTVLMVQVENETGLLGDSRDRSRIAERLFSEPVPLALMQQLQIAYKQNAVHPNFKKHFPRFLDTVPGKDDWRKAFSNGDDDVSADEIFMAWALSQYVGHVAAAGKAEYPLPLYTNVWLNIDDPSVLDLNDIPIVVGGGAKAGIYPSGGPCPHTMDIWKINAPSLDFIGPDLYVHDYEVTCRDYVHNDQPLFIPEQRRDEKGARRIWLAYGTHQALGCSPFGIDSSSHEYENEPPIAKHFALLNSIKFVLLEAHRERPGETFGFFFDPPSAADLSTPSWTKCYPSIQMKVIITRAFVLGKAGPGAGLVIHQGDGCFLAIGWGFSLSFASTKPTATWSGILRAEEKEVDTVLGELKTIRILGGDETKHGDCLIMANENPDYGGFPVAITPPCNTMIAEVWAYDLEETNEEY